MFLRHLGFLVALAREKHFGRAAEACQVSQPALSSAIRNMEAELGIAIVHRNQRFSGFTQEGERVLDWARKVLKEYETLRDDQGHSSADIHGMVRLGVIPATVPLVSGLILACQARNRHVQKRVFTLSATSILRRLEQFELDIGLTYMDDDRLQAFDAFPIFEERYMVFARDAGAFEGKQSMTWAEVADLPLCLFVPEMQCRQGIDRALARHARPVAPVMEADSLPLLCAQLHASGMFGILPHSARLMPITGMSMAAIPIKPMFRRWVGLVLYREDMRSRAVEATLNAFLAARLDA